MQIESNCSTQTASIITKVYRYNFSADLKEKPAENSVKYYSEIPISQKKSKSTAKHKQVIT